MRLFADRFLVDDALLQSQSGDGDEEMSALDLASGAEARLSIAPAGDRAEQQLWSQACAEKHASGVLLDFGFVGRDSRFEASASIGFGPPVSVSNAAHVIDW